MENENIQPILFAGPEVCVLEDYISKTNFDWCWCCGTCLAYWRSWTA